MEEQMRALGARWAEAEQRGDVATLDALLASDFAAIGPRGFVLDRRQWLDRYRSGDLRNQAFNLRDVVVRGHDSAAIAIGIQEQRSTFQGHDASGRFRVALVAMKQGDAWRIANVQLSGPIPDAPLAGGERQPLPAAQ